MRGGQDGDDQISTAVLPRLNALLVTGNGELFATVERVIKSIDLPPAEGTTRVVKVYEVFGADLRVVRNMIREAVGSEPTNWWEDDSSEGALVEYDRDAQIVIVSGTQKEQDLALQVVETFKAAVIKPELKVEVLALEYAPAGEVGGMLSRFVRDRADALGEAEPAVAIGTSNPVKKRR